MNQIPNLTSFRANLAAAIRSRAIALAPVGHSNRTTLIQQNLRARLGTIHAQILAARSAGPLHDLVDSYLAVAGQLAATLPQPAAPAGSILGAAISASADDSSWRETAASGGVDNPRSPRLPGR